MTQLLLYIAFEDELTFAVIQKILQGFPDQILISKRLTGGGFGYLKRNAAAFNQLANKIPLLLVTDLDRAECAPKLIREWCPHPLHTDFLFRIAVREIEAWVMADRELFASWLNIPKAKIPAMVDDIPDAKIFLINLVRNSRKSNLKKDIVPDLDSTARVGKNYNEPLIRFVNESWSVNRALEHSPSLARLFRRMNELVERKTAK